VVTRVCVSENQRGAKGDERKRLADLHLENDVVDEVDPRMVVSVGSCTSTILIPRRRFARLASRARTMVRNALSLLFGRLSTRHPLCET
jgi:hypothetical protein